MNTQESNQHSGLFGFEDIATDEKRTFDTLDELSEFLRKRADDADDARKLVAEPVTEDSLICMKPSHKRLEEQLEALQTAARSTVDTWRGQRRLMPMAITNLDAVLNVSNPAKKPDDD